MGCGSETYTAIMDAIDLHEVPVPIMWSREGMLNTDERDLIRGYMERISLIIR